jgi:hypothetical protein
MLRLQPAKMDSSQGWENIGKMKTMTSNAGFGQVKEIGICKKCVDRIPSEC